MNDDKMIRLAVALTKKHTRFYPQLSLDVIETIVGTTVADVQLVEEGTITIEDFENERPITLHRVER